MTNESRFAALHQRRDISLKNLRESALRITKGDNVSQIDTLLRDQVCIRMLIHYKNEAFLKF